MSNAPKTSDLPAVAKDVSKMYPYVIENLRESSTAEALRKDAATLDHSIMIGGPDVAALLGWLIRLTGAKKAIEVGTFRGTTTLWLAEALPTDGKVVALDIKEEYAAIGKKYWAEAGVAEKVDFRVGPAADTMAKMLADGEAGQYDLCFIDADKVGYDSYYEAALALLRPGGIVAIDNVLWSAKVVQKEEEQSADTKAIVALNRKVREDKRVDALLLPMSDGLTLARKVL